MKKWFSSSFLISICCISCGTFSKARLNHIALIHPGQSPSEVISVMGEPSHRMSKGDTEIWYYDLYANDNATTYPYSAKFEQGALKSFDADRSRRAEDQDLCRQRKLSKQTLILEVGINGAPALDIDCSD